MKWWILDHAARVFHTAKPVDPQSGTTSGRLRNHGEQPGPDCSSTWRFLAYRALDIVPQSSSWYPIYSLDVRTVAIHDEVLRAARAIGSARADFAFGPAEIVVALPHLNAASVRTHVIRGAHPGARRRPRCRVGMGPDAPDPVLGLHERHVDRTLVRQALRMTHDERLRSLQHWITATEEIRSGIAELHPRGARPSDRRS